MSQSSYTLERSHRLKNVGKHWHTLILLVLGYTSDWRLQSPDVINTNTAGIMFLFHSNHSSQLSKNQNMKRYLRFDVLVAIKLSLAVFLVVLPYSFVYGYQHFRSTYHLHLQPWKWRWYFPLILWNPLKITLHHNPEWPESTWKECF
jgi:hypothetical protein